jgi:ATP-dependent DNA helicase RecQ
MQTREQKDQTMAEDKWLAALREMFGFTEFRPYQEDIVHTIEAGQDAFVVMPTGGGKSLCYQLPAHVLPGLCVVISPLISLMKDQVDAAQQAGLRASVMNSSQTYADRARVARAVAAGELDLLYVSPERFALEDFKQLLASANLAFVAIDEAHCISEWGHDFRPDYLTLSDIVLRFPYAPIAAFTATATMKVQQDIITKLGLRNPHCVRASFNRPNLYYEVQPKDNTNRQLLRFIQEHPEQQGIVYRGTQKDTDKTAAYLREQGVKALPYHAGMSNGERAASQEAFNRDEVHVIVATIAFGMGIDKSNVRFVIHADLPKNIEGYYQETGRAGRDGEPAHCLLLFSRGDAARIRHFIDPITDAQAREHALRCLNAMVRYGGVHQCRRKQLLGYFGEQLPGTNCGMCDVCADKVETIDATVDAQMILSAIVRTGQRFGMHHIIDVVTGADTQKIRDNQHDKIKTYGIGRTESKAHWRRVMDQLMAQEMVVVSADKYPVLRVSEEGRAILRGEVKVIIVKTVERRAKARRSESVAYNQELFGELRDLRKQCAAEIGKPPFIIFSDRSLHEMAARMPVQLSEMAAIHGVGAHKLEQYGERFCRTIRSFRERHRP